MNYVNFRFEERQLSSSKKVSKSLLSAVWFTYSKFLASVLWSVALGCRSDRAKIFAGPEMARRSAFFHFRSKRSSISTIMTYTVKLVRAKLDAMAAGILFRRQNYPRMQAKISAGNDCLRSPQVKGGNLPAPAYNLGEAFIVLVRADFHKPRDVFFYPVPNTLTEVTNCCPWSQW